jgi:hypothetical protein
MPRFASACVIVSELSSTRESLRGRNSTFIKGRFQSLVREADCTTGQYIVRLIACLFQGEVRACLQACREGYVSVCRTFRP